MCPSFTFTLPFIVDDGNDVTDNNNRGDDFCFIKSILFHYNVKIVQLKNVVASS